MLQRAPRREAAPALGAADQDGVRDEEEEREPVREARGQRGAVEAEAEGVDEEVVEEGVEGRGDEEDVGAGPVDLCWGESECEEDGEEVTVSSISPCAWRYFFMDSNHTYPRPPGIRQRRNRALWTQMYSSWPRARKMGSEKNQTTATTA